MSSVVCIEEASEVPQLISFVGEGAGITGLPAPPGFVAIGSVGPGNSPPISVR